MAADVTPDDPAPSPEPLSERRLRRPRVAFTVRALVVHGDATLFIEGHDPGRPYYFLPGGHVEHGERLDVALAREVLEETGVRVVVERPLYLREFIAARHRRRAHDMPPDHHVLGLLFLARPDPAHHDLSDIDTVGKFPGAIDGVRSIRGLRWLRRSELDGLEIMPPHVARALRGDDVPFPPPPEAGIALWPEDDEG